MWKHDFPNRLGNPAPREEAEPTETERQVRVQSGKKSSRRIRFGKTASAKTEEEEKTAKKASPAMSTAPEQTNGGAPAAGAQKASGKAAEKASGKTVEKVSENPAEKEG